MSSARGIRLLIDGPASGAWNMAVDEALLLSAQGGQATLRFYQWSPATLSLGYFQSHADRARHAPSQSCAMVRRTTGGGAILHDRELTYSIALPCRERFSTSAEGIYDALHDSLVASLAKFGISASRCERSDPTREENFLCFERRARGDVLLAEFKIAGSAQRRHGGALLQHGSVLLAASEHAPTLPGIAELAGCVWEPPEFIEIWNQELSSALGAKLYAGSYSNAEITRAHDVAANRYEQGEWTNRR